MFFRGSRYEHIADATTESRDGRTIRYKRMRFVPVAGLVPTAIKVIEGDRPDLVAFRTLGDPEQFWRLCDVNLVRRPVDLTGQSGSLVAIPGPVGGT
jgi:hypothetical protein